MNSFFVKNAKPKTTRSRSYMTWVQLCKIKAKKKTRQRRTLKRRQIIANTLRDDVTHLKKFKEYPGDIVLGKFMETKWNGNHKVPKKYDDEKEALSMDDFEIKDSTEDKYLVAFEKGDSSRCVFAKNSRYKARFHLATKRNIQRVRWFTPTLVEWKPHIDRGENVIVSTMDTQSLR